MNESQSGQNLKAGCGERNAALERSIGALARSQPDLVGEVKGIREDLERKRGQRFALDERIDRLERHAA